MSNTAKNTSARNAGRPLLYSPDSEEVMFLVKEYAENKTSGRKVVELFKERFEKEITYATMLNYLRRAGVRIRGKGRRAGQRRGFHVYRGGAHKLESGRFLAVTGGGYFLTDSDENAKTIIDNDGLPENFTINDGGLAVPTNKTGK